MGKYITLNHLDQTVWSLLQKIDAKTDDRISDEDITKWNSPVSYDSLTNKPYIPTSQDVTSAAEYTILHGNYPVSTFQNDMGYLTSYTETDPTVPSWAKASNKPTYTAAEVGALPDTTVIPEDKVFIATYGTTSYADTLAAYNAGKLIFGILSDSSNGKLIIPLTGYGSGQFQFEGKYLVGRSKRISLYLHSTGWSISTYFGDISGRSANIESGDSLIIRDVNGGQVNKYSTLTFGTSTNQYLANNGTWQTLPDIAGFSVSVVQTLPAENIDDHTIYFLSNNGDSGNIYDEYMYVNNTWEIIGSTEVDLSNYLQKTEIADWAKAATKPTYTAREVGAVPTQKENGDKLAYIKVDASPDMGVSLHYDNDADPDVNIQLNGSGLTLTAGDRSGTNTLQMDGNTTTIHNIVTPTANGDAANKQYVDNKVSGLTAADVGALPSSTVIPTVPTNVSEFINDAGYLTSYTETDPTVPAWAKASSKPTYTAAEVGALPDTTVIPDISGKVDKAGDTMTGDLQFANGKGIVLNYKDNTDRLYLMGYGSNYRVASFEYSTTLRNIRSPDSDTSAVNKAYVDNKATLQTTAGSNNTEYNLIGTATSNTNNSAVKIYNPGSISFAKTTNEGRLTLGSSSLPGKLRLYSSTDSASGFTDLISGASSTNERTITLPDATGTVALTSDIPNVPSWALAANKPTYTAAEVGATTSSDVSGMISSAVSGITSFSMEVVNSLPATGVAGRIYFVTGNNNTNDIYEEYIYVNNSWEKLGNFDATNVDLSGYLQTGDIAAWAKAANKPSYTASEVGALPSNTTYVSSFNGESGAITYIPPVTSVNGQTGAVTLTIPDADDHKWNDVSLNKSTYNDDGDYYVPAIINTSGTTAKLISVQQSATSRSIPRRNSQGYISSTTPPANSNNNYVATTAYVDSAVSGITDTNTTYTISISGNVITLTPSSGTAQTITLPVYNGGVE